MALHYVALKNLGKKLTDDWRALQRRVEECGEDFPPDLVDAFEAMERVGKLLADARPGIEGVKLSCSCDPLSDEQCNDWVHLGEQLPYALEKQREWGGLSQR
jgi:hypothetical protein